MFTSEADIKRILSGAKSLYYLEAGERVMLVAGGEELYRSRPFGSTASQPFSSVVKVVFNYDLGAWQVVFKSDEVQR